MNLDVSAIENLAPLDLVEANYLGRHPRQLNIYLTIDEDGKVGTDRRDLDIDGMPKDWSEGETLAVCLPANVDASKLASWVDQEETTFNFDEFNIDQWVLENCPTHDLGGLMDAGDWLQHVDLSITHKTTDAEIEAKEKNLRADALNEGVILDGLAEYLESIREEKIDDEMDED